ncbi:unnamed protein product [Rotaria sordida]|uniref:Uncharacterized protein n=1 Tax=Rotaria sordida TaxID=392033 RepID=A0A819CFB3_9BILA|nr:unnamed protein product [Rotaria sordida]CAF3818917.1 unnamed protein product [Rotaria sordida]
MTDIENAAEIIPKKLSLTSLSSENRSRITSIVDNLAVDFHTSISSIVPIVIDEINENDKDISPFSIRKFGATFLTSILSDIFGLKWTIIIGEIAYVLYISANIRPIPILMYIDAVCIGLASAPLWTCQATYTSYIAHYQQKKVADVVSLFFGIFFAFFFATTFVTCLVGIRYIGLVLICFGICNALCSYIFGDLVKYIGRIGCFIIAAVLNYASIIVMYFWKPFEDQMYVLFIIANAVWQLQVVAAYTVLYSKTYSSAIAKYRL